MVLMPSRLAPINIPVHVIAHIDHLGRRELQDIEGLREKPRIGFPESVICPEMMIGSK